MNLRPRMLFGRSVVLEVDMRNGSLEVERLVPDRSFHKPVNLRSLQPPTLMKNSREMPGHPSAAFRNESGRARYLPPAFQT